MKDPSNGFVWFDDVRVFLRDWRLMCAVNGQVVPLPVLLLHPDCTLSGDGDVGRLAYPVSGRRTAGLSRTEPSPLVGRPDAPEAPSADELATSVVTNRPPRGMKSRLRREILQRAQRLPEVRPG